MTSTVTSPSKSAVHNVMAINGQCPPLYLSDSFFRKQNQRILSGNNINDKRIRCTTIPSQINRQLSDIHSNDNLAISNNIATDLISNAKALVNEAIKNKTIFSIFGPYEKIRCILKQRGWIEKKVECKPSTSNNWIKSRLSDLDLVPNINGDSPQVKLESKISSETDNYPDRRNNVNELHIISSQLVSNCVPDFIWSLKVTQIDFRNIKPSQMINHFRKAGSFTTKTGLIKSFNNLRWYEKNPDEVYPRSYIISDEEEKKAFLNDYYLTACLSLVRLTADMKEFLNENIETEENNNFDKTVYDLNSSKSQGKKVKPVIDYSSKEVGFSKLQIDRRYPEMAMNFCQMYLQNLKNKDLDKKELVFCSAKKWEEFFENFLNVTFEGYNIQCTVSIRDKCQQLCEEFQKHLCQYNLNGTKNIWIVKPGAKSRGRGISCISKFAEIHNLFRSSVDTLIVQKYIERPFLIYNTKFDIRQWFLVTSWSPLTIWWYKDCYIRFCSQQFTLNDFNEAIHLSNNSIQHKYQNGPRSKYLPNSNMWEWEKFEKYLHDNGYENSWRKEILPSMKNIIIDILLCSQEEIEDRKNSFELYGADFMITEGDLKTWLLEINSSPCMSPSTDVTAKLTQSVLEDIIKVVLDYPKNIYCDTGQFELLYKQSPFAQAIIDKSNDLTVVGNGIKKPCLNVFSQSHEGIHPKFVVEENSNLKNKLRLLVENCGAFQNNFKFDEPIKKHHYQHYKLVQDIRNEPNCILNHQSDMRFRSHSQYPSYSINVLSNKDEQPITNLPIIKSFVSKSTDKCSFKIKKQVNEKNIKQAYPYESTKISKINSMRTIEGQNNKRIDQLIKAYMPNMANK